jgi:hypothetical protein
MTVRGLGGLPRRRVDQQPAQPMAPLSPNGLSIAQLTAAGLLTNADLIALGLAKESTQIAQSTTIPAGIATAGVPLLSASTSLLSFAPTVIAAGGTFTQGPLDITQLGYEIFIGVQAGVGAVLPAIAVLLTWSDTTTGNVVSQERWHLTSGNGAQQQYYGTGSSKGDTLTITYTNSDNAASVTVQSSFAGNSRIYVRDDWRQLTNVGVPTFTNGTYDQQANFLLSTSPTVPASSSLARICALYAGLVNIFVSAAASANVIVSMIGNATLTLPIVYASPIIAAGGVLNTQISLPRGNCVITLQNNAAAGNVMEFTATIAEQPA